MSTETTSEKPTIYLDLDRTIYDTDQFYALLHFHTDSKKLTPEQRAEVLRMFEMSEQEIDWKSLVYPDTIQGLILLRTRYRVALVTFSPQVQFQHMKIVRSGIEPYIDASYVVDGNKSEAIRKDRAIIGNTTRQYFVDDRLDHLADVRSEFPDITCVAIARPRAMGAQEALLEAPVQGFPIVSNLDELILHVFRGDTSW